ncbi:MAG: hypothetical protein AB7V44_06195 [Pseudonocardia sp.]
MRDAATPGRRRADHDHATADDVGTETHDGAHHDLDIDLSAEAATDDGAARTRTGPPARRGRAAPSPR